MHLDPRNFERRGYEIVGQRDGARLAALLVIDKLLKERLADALRDPADDLALDHRRIDDGADVFGSDITHDLDFTGLRVDVDHGDMSAACEAAEFWIVERGDFKARVELRRNVLGREVALLRHLAKRQSFRTIDRLDYTVDDGELFDRHLQEVRAQSKHTAAQFLGGLDHRATAEHRRAGRKRAEPVRRHGGVVNHAGNVVETDAELVAGNLPHRR